MRCVRLWPAHTHAYAPSRNSPCLTTVVQTHSRTEGAHWQSAPPPPAAPHVPSQMAAGATQLLMLSSLFLWPGLRPVKGTRAETTIAPRTLLRSYATPSCRSFSSRFACALCAFPRRRSARAPPPAASPAAAAGAAGATECIASTRTRASDQKWRVQAAAHGPVAIETATVARRAPRTVRRAGLHRTSGRRAGQRGRRTPMRPCGRGRVRQRPAARGGDREGRGHAALAHGSWRWWLLFLRASTLLGRRP